MSEMHTIEQGENLASIAQDFDFLDWHTIYDHPKNAEFKKRRPNPNVLLPGDQVFIPDKQLKQESCPTDQKHRFQVKSPKAWLKIMLKDADEKPIKNQPYRLNLDGYRVIQGTTDGKGLLQKEIPVGTNNASLMLDTMGITFTLQIGHLDPIEEVDKKVIVTGIQARLNNLGFHCGEIDGVLGERTRAAVRRFQLDVMKRKKASGEPDAETQEAMVQQHGC